MANKPIMIFPEGSLLPENHQLTLIEQGDLVERLTRALDADIPAMHITHRELQCIVEYPDVFGRDFIVLDGLVGGRYDTVWDSFTTGISKLTPDLLPGEVAAIKQAKSAKVEADAFDTIAERISPKLSDAVNSTSAKYNEEEEGIL